MMVKMPFAMVGGDRSTIEECGIAYAGFLPDPRVSVEGPIVFHGLPARVDDSIALVCNGREIGRADSIEVNLTARTTSLYVVLYAGENPPDVFKDALSVLGLALRA